MLHYQEQTYYNQYSHEAKRPKMTSCSDKSKYIVLRLSTQVSCGLHGVQCYSSVFVTLILASSMHSVPLSTGLLQDSG